MADRGPGAGEGLKFLAWDDRNLTAGQHLDVVIGLVEEQVLEVQRFTGNMQGEDLSPALCGDLLSVGEAR